MRRWLRVLEFAACYMLYNFLTVGTHEWIHLRVLKWLGGDGYIQATMFGGECVVTKLPEHGLWLFYLSGGLMTGLIMLALALLEWMDRDYEKYAALQLCAWPQLTYAVFECLFPDLPLLQYLWWSPLALAAGDAVGGLFAIHAFKQIRNEVRPRW